MRKFISIVVIAFVSILFFWQFFVKGLLPIPSDTIVGLYHPFRDLYAKDYPRGIPFKNSLITDPVRQEYPWRELVVSLEKKLNLPLWNPYSFSGTPLLANFQSASFYPLNILFFLLPFNFAWSLLIFIQPVLAGIFTYLYLSNLRLSKLASILGAISFSFSGFSIAWLEWGTILNATLWLPLILLSIDKVFTNFKSTANLKLQFRIRNYFWPIIFIFSLASAFFAGHLQTFFYLFIVSWAYFFVRWIQYGKIFNILFVFLIFNILFLILTSIQWIPTLQFILLSARNIDSVSFNNLGWFIPWQHLIQFLVPDFFGNPTTLNYWGTWNYGEFVGYVGILPLIMAIFAIVLRHDKKTLFFGTLLSLSLIFALPTIFAKIPFYLNIPFISTAQPTRLLFLICFSLSVLSAFGFDYFLRRKNGISYPLAFIGFVFVLLWGFIIVNSHGVAMYATHLLVAKRNLFFPTSIFILIAICLLSFKFEKRIKIVSSYTLMIYIIIVCLTVFDLLRFGWKFTSFTKKEYLFPNTSAISFLQKNDGQFRIMATDSQLLPPNFSVFYRLQSVDGYDPLYIRRYGELIAASQRGEPNITPPFGFNRIITPHNYDSKIIDLLGVKYVLSLSDLDFSKLKKVFQEGETRVYENKNVLPRAFFVSKIVYVNDNKEAIKLMFKDSFSSNNIAIVENPDRKLKSIKKLTIGKEDITYYSENKIIIETENSGTGFLVLTDSFYPTWHAKIDNNGTKIYRTDYNFRGIVVPEGKHVVEFYDSLF